MATVSKSGDTYTVSGGSSSAPITLKDVVAATNSDLVALNRNAAQTFNKAAHKYVFDANSHVDMTDARVFLRNSGNGQKNYFQFQGHISVGGNNDKVGYCEIHYGDHDSGWYSTDNFPLFGANAVINCPKEDNRIKIMSHLDGPSASDPNEPGSRNGVYIGNNVAGNKIRVSVLGASYNYGSSYVLPSQTLAKANGTMILNWSIGSNVVVRDLEFRDGYVDWRPAGTWAAPTRGVFVSETWMKFLGSADFSYANPLIFGNENDSFEVVVGNSGQQGSFILHGLFPNNGNGRIVYNNYKGLTWQSQMALYGANHGIRVENHLELSYALIDSFAQPVDSAEITVYKKDPVYNSQNNGVTFTQDGSFVVTTDSTGKGNLGNADGNLSHNICVEAFCRYGTGGDTDVAYASAAHNRAGYGSNTDIRYSIIKWGFKPIIKSQYVAKLSGQTGEGKQSLGVIQLEKDLSLTATSPADVPSTITDAVSLYDNIYKYCVDNKIPVPATREGNKIVTDRKITFDAAANELISFDADKIIVKASTFTSDIKASHVLFIKEFDLSDMTIDATVNYFIDHDAVINYNGVTITHSVFNGINHKLTINASNSSITAGDAGTGNGETNIVNTVPIEVIVKDITTGDPIEGATVYIAGVMKEATDANGKATIAYNYTSDIAVDGVVRKATTGILYQQAKLSGTITSSGFAATVLMIRDG